VNDTATMTLWRRAQHGWPARFPIVQFPNAPLIVALGASVVGHVSSGTLHDVARVVSLLGLITWAVMEIVSGANWLRRLMGAGFLAYLAVRALA
jgi:hypothetical protein